MREWRSEGVKEKVKRLASVVHCVLTYLLTYFSLSLSLFVSFSQF